MRSLLVSGETLRLLEVFGAETDCQVFSRTWCVAGGMSLEAGFYKEDFKWHLRKKSR